MVSNSPRSRLAVRRAHTGLTLIELMVALAIGMFLMIGAITVFMQGRTTFRVTESLSRLQENARFALDSLEPDIRMAQHYGLTNVGANIEGRVGTTVPGGVPTTCGNTWVHDFERGVAGTNNTYSWTCGVSAAAGAAMANSDTLVVRRVSEDPVLAGRTAGTLYIQSSRSDKSQLFVGAALPGSPDPTTSQPYRVVVNGYFVSTNNSSGLSTATNTVPSLRMKTLIDGGTIVEREILAGVEDMQVQFGLDTSLPTTAGRGSIDRFVNTNDALLANPGFRNDERQIMAVRIWLRVRAERPENGFVDGTAYNYAGQNFGPFNDGFRRVVVSKTIFLRNGVFR
jgi:type IV pilus assembly protein PilW